MKVITAFFMAWGNFLTIPCPYKKWDNDLKNTMLAFLPSVGAVVGGLWVLLIWVIRFIAERTDLPFTIPISLGAVIAVYFLFASCGFMHMDGFMDCTDAIMSRRPLEVRQKILKDSNVGAFAVVMVVFLLLTWYAAMGSAAQSASLAAFFLIPVASRSMAALSVMGCKPIGHSQYKEDFDKPKTKLRAAVIAQLAVYGVIAAFCAGAWMPAGMITLITGLAVIAGASIAGWYARRQLGGMSGDVAGYMICYGELTGIITLALLS